MATNQYGSEVRSEGAGKRVSSFLKKIDSARRRVNVPRGTISVPSARKIAQTLKKMNH